MIVIERMILGIAYTNTYLVWDSRTGSGVVIDPAWDGERIYRKAEDLGINLEQIWITHAHFDHFAGIGGVLANLPSQVDVVLHAQDLPLWEAKGGAPLFGVELPDNLPKPTKLVNHGDTLVIGDIPFEVRHTPGHTQGHVVYYSPITEMVFCGDVIFQGSIGRTDLPGGDYQTLINSINSNILDLPDDARLYPGHGEITNVGAERASNPFLIGW